MSRARFNHVFLALMLISGLCAFVLPPTTSNFMRGRIDGLFAPVAYPLRRVARGVSVQLQARADNTPVDASGASPVVRAEIEHLRAAVVSLTMQLEQLQRIHADRQLLGDAQKYCTPFPVIGGDRESLTVVASSGGGLAAGMAAVHRDSIVGKIASAGNSGAQLRLITDRGFKVAGLIGRFNTAADGKVGFVKVPTPPLLVEGRGNGVMVITNLTVQQVKDAHLSEEDVVYLNDPDDWPMPINGYLIGRITQIIEMPKAPLYAEITVTPKMNLKQLREVMVVTGKTTAAPAVQVSKPQPITAAPQVQQKAASKAPVRRSRGGN
jgi:hypothetical protein